MGRGLPDSRSIPVPDLEELNQVLAAPRPSLSPSHFTTQTFGDFQRSAFQSMNEGEIMKNVVSIICADTHNIPSTQNLLFNKPQPITHTIVDSKPDLYDGVRLNEVNRMVQEDLGYALIPTGHAMAPVAPNFFLEVKGPRGSDEVVIRQACYNGALGARAMSCPQSYKQKLVFDNKPYTITATYHGGTLSLYTSHLVAGPEDIIEFHKTHVNSWSLRGNYESFRQGVTALRNARDWAQKQRNVLLSAANERAKSVAGQSSTEAKILALPTYRRQSTGAPMFPRRNSDISKDSNILGTSLSSRKRRPEPLAGNICKSLRKN